MTGTGHTSTESAPVNTVPESDPTRLPGSPDEQRRREAIDAGVEEIRRLYGSGITPFGQLQDATRRRLGLAVRSAGNAALGVLMSVGVRLGLALLVTAFFGQWTDIPWGRWAVITVYFGLFDANLPWRFPPLDEPLSPRQRRFVEDMTPLLPTIVRESDLQDLADFVRRWNRAPVVAAVGVLVTTLIIGAGWLLAPAALSELPVGSVVLLAFLLFDFGSALSGLFEWAFVARQARYDHDLFWPSPADSPEVRKAMQMLSLKGTAFWITGVLVLTLVLVSWDSPLVLPLSVGFIGIGYLVVVSSALGSRASIRKIVESCRQQRLEVLRERINHFKSHYADLSTRESEQLRDLLFLHDRIRDAPASPSATHTVLRAAAGLIVPTTRRAMGPPIRMPTVPVRNSARAL